MKDLSPSSVARLSQPSKCERRTWLRDVAKLQPAPIGVFGQFLIDQGLRHEEQVLEGLKREHPDLEVFDLGELRHPEATARTAELVANRGKALIYQGHLQGKVSIAGEDVSLVGYPDFLFCEDGRWTIGDAKLARRTHKIGKDGTVQERSEKKVIFHQLRLYGWLFEESFPEVPFQLRVYNGSGEIEDVGFEDVNEVLEELGRVLAIQSMTEEPAEVVGWSKCAPCGYRQHCWPRAEENQELGCIVDIDQRLGNKLLALGINTYSDVVAQLDERSLAAVKTPAAAAADEKARAGARRILENIEAVEKGKVILRKDNNGNIIPIDPAIFASESYVMFDLEGLPPQLDEAEKVYLWGMQVFGQKVGEFIPALADFGDEGDRRGWEEFLKQARGLLLAHPSIWFVHWSSYERTRITQYIGRYGDDEHGTADEVLKSLLDLLPIAKAAVAIPAPSYSLKVIEKLDAVRLASGFSRTADDVAKGDDSIAAYIEAVETEDMSRRSEIVDAIVAYNKEDLEATWAVQVWLQELAGSNSNLAAGT